MCADIILKNGIKLPTMYELGFHNNNCIGCVKLKERLLESHKKTLSKKPLIKWQNQKGVVAGDLY